MNFSFRQKPIADCRLPIAFRHRRQTGLTVLELVSALSLFVIILGMLFIAVNGASDIWSHSSTQNKSQQSMRRVMEKLGDDLACAMGQPMTDTSDKPWFVLDYPSARTNQCGLYFVKSVSPAEVSGENMRSLELVAYVLATETNVLSRYTAPVSLNTDANTDVGEQLNTFYTSHRPDSTIVSNVLSTLVTTFGVIACTNTPPARSTNPAGSYDNSPGRTVKLYSLPDFVDIGLAYTNRDDTTKGYTHINYMTRRVTFPAAPASRQP
jgi:type II secretory pathway component PulJ